MSHNKAHRAHKEKFHWFVLCLLCLFVANVKADDGYRLWLRYDQLPSANTYRSRIKSISVQGKSATFDLIRRELSQGCSGLLGTRVEVGERDDASVVVGLPQTSTLIRKLGWESELASLGPEGFRIRTIRDVVVIASTTDIGAL